MCTNSLVKREKIDSLQALRAIASLAIMASHTGLLAFKGAGKWGVSVFFILSGFLLIYSYWNKDRIQEYSISKNLIFAWNKIKGLYLLHILTTLAMLIFMFTGEFRDPLSIIIPKLGLNLVMLHEWTPIGPINGTSWYLCTAIFCYFIFPWILRYMEKRYNQSKAIKNIVCLFVLQIFLGYIGGKIPPIPCSPINSRGDLTEWFVYYFPPVRCVDFIIGCNLGYLFLTMTKSQADSFFKKTPILSCITIIGIVIANILFVIVHLDTTPLTPYPERWWTYTSIYTLSSCLLVYIMAHNKSKLSKALTTPTMVYIGNISQYTFLIHNVIFRYILTAIAILPISAKVSEYISWINLSFGFVLTFIATKIWMLLTHKNIKR